MLKKQPLPQTIEKMLVDQIAMEHRASMNYLAMAIWAEVRDYEVAAAYLKKQSSEERTHMILFIHYLTDLGYHPLLPEECTLQQNYESLHHLFEMALEQEKAVTISIHQIAETALSKGDFSTFQFLQRFIEEQRKEVHQAKQALVQFDLLGKEKSALYWVDQALKKMSEEA